MDTANHHNTDTTHNAGGSSRTLQASPSSSLPSTTGLHFQTTILCCAEHPDYQKVKGWALRRGVVVIDSYEASANDAKMRALGLFAKLGALGCEQSHKTALVEG